MGDQVCTSTYLQGGLSADCTLTVQRGSLPKHPAHEKCLALERKSSVPANHNSGQPGILLLIRQEREQTYIRGIRTFDISGQVPLLAGISGAHHLFSIYPSATHITWSEGYLQKRKNIENGVLVTVTHVRPDYRRGHAGQPTGFYHHPPSPLHDTRFSLPGAQPLQCLDLRRPCEWHSPLPHDHITSLNDLFASAHGIFSLPYSAITIDSMADGGLWDNAALISYLKNRAVKGVKQCPIWIITEPTESKPALARLSTCTTP